MHNPPLNLSPTPLTLVTGIHPDAMEATVLALMLDLPRAVVVRHRIDVERSVLVRLVSDITGIVEHEEIDLEHACVPCAIREDVVPTLVRVAADPRWASVIAHLPVAAQPDQVCHVLGTGPHPSTPRVTTVIAAVDGTLATDDLLGEDLLDDRGLATSATDRRGVGEVLAELVEFADLTVVSRAGDPVGVNLLRALAAPHAAVVTGTDQIDPDVLAGARHDLVRTRTWTDPVRAFDLPRLDLPGTWQVDLHSARAFHPGRLLAGLESLGSGRHRSRGCFWLPSRPGEVQVWAGAGGQVSVGTGQSWGRAERRTRIVITGAGVAPDRLRTAFEDMLLAPGETYPAGSYDGFEPWLGPIRDVA